MKKNIDLCFLHFVKLSILFFCFLFLFTSCSGPGGLNSSTSNNQSASNTSSTMKLSFQWPDSNTPTYDYTNSRARAFILDYPSTQAKVIPAGTERFKVIIYQHPQSSTPDSNIIWDVVYNQVLSRTQYPGDSVEISVNNLPPGPTKIYIGASENPIGDGTEDTEHVMYPTACCVKFFNILTGENTNVDGALDEYYFFGDSTGSVTSTTETVSVPSGTFTNCVKVVVNIAYSHRISASSQKNYIEGQKTAWFKDGIGLVKFIYSHNDGSTTTCELTSYAVTPDGNFWPFTPGNTWSYSWSNSLYHPESFSETIRVNPANDFEGMNSPDGYDPATDSILVVSNLGEIELESINSYFVIRNSGGLYRVFSYNVNAYLERAGFPLNTFYSYDFWGLNEPFLPTIPVVGNTVNSNPMTIFYGNSVYNDLE